MNSLYRSVLFEHGLNASSRALILTDLNKNFDRVSLQSAVFLTVGRCRSDFFEKNELHAGKRAW